MAEWQPSTQAEAALRDALRAGDQDRYFHILSQLELLLPVPPEGTAQGTGGWGTWTADRRTHVLAFTSYEAMYACLAQNAGSARTVPYLRLAEQWPNHEWWLAVNPGLPIEGYLPAWFIAQLAQQIRAELSRPEPPRLPPPGAMRESRPPAMDPGTRNGAQPRSRAERLEALARAQAGATGYAPSTPPAVNQPPMPPPPPPAAVPPPVGPPPKAEPRQSTGTPLLELESAGRPAGGRHADAFIPANEVERQLFDAAEVDNTDLFLSTLLLAQVLVPVAPSASHVLRPSDPNFGWQTQQIDGQPYVVVFTSTERAGGQAGQCVRVRFIQLISSWPDETWSFAVNPGTPVGATLPGDQVVTLANWAGRMGLSSEETSEIRSSVPAVSPKAAPPTVMQKPISPSQIGFYLERGYDRVSGFVHRAHEVGQLKTPDQMRQALGLTWQGTPFEEEADEVFILRWSAYRPSLYRIPYGGQTEAAMKAMEGWVIERPPFRGNGFAPGESSTVIAEFKVDSARLPHGARLLRLGADGVEEIIAVLDADGPRWLRVGEYPRKPAPTPEIGGGEGRPSVEGTVEGTVEGELVGEEEES
ncbi:MAG: SseB family protein [Hamadaea sp.]|uniref:SseB family protein n=1 Tax=Hamadaea sp. TaxID=2024425 RepID=UPI0017DA4B2C|nr:SseB family protein [Hamadaea sp.]NUR74246.1 SseB family protein [Hamadaea sp.]NUT19391.1 SseB family protein [Hamadaea sp.]